MRGKDNTIQFEHLSYEAFLRIFHEEDTAIKYVEAIRWPDGIVCPKCNSRRIVEDNSPKRRHWCSSCRRHFTVRYGTMMHKSRLPMGIWLYVTYEMLISRNGISSWEIYRRTGVSQKHAARLLHKIRHAMGDENNPDKRILCGIIEVDEMYHGGRNKNKHGDKKLSFAEASAAKMHHVGFVERATGRRILVHVKHIDQSVIQDLFLQHIELDSTICTDESKLYKRIEPLYNRLSVNHSHKSYVDGHAHTNTIESTWGRVSKDYIGTYTSYTHMYAQLYLNEIAYRQSYAKVKNGINANMDALMSRLLHTPYKSYKQIQELYGSMRYNPPDRQRYALHSFECYSNASAPVSIPAGPG